MFAARLYLPSGKTVRPVAASMTIASTVYQAKPAENTSTQPATWAQPSEPKMYAPARMPEPAASVESTATRPRLSAVAAIAAIAVVIASAKNQNPTSGLWYHGTGAARTCVASRRFRIPYASQNAPHVPCASVAIASRARYAHIPATNCARPPNIAANGARIRPDAGDPHQPAMFDATMKVAPANPARPRTEGAATGGRKTRGGAKPSAQSAASEPASAVLRRSSSVAMVVQLLSIASRSILIALRSSYTSRFAD